MAPKVAESEAGIHSSVTAETVVTAGDDPHALLLAAKRLAVAKEYEGAIKLFKEIVAYGPESSTAGLALVELGRLARQTRDAGLAQYLADQAGKGSPHRATVLGLLVSYYRSADDDHTALAEAALLADEYPGTWQAFYAQVSAFRLHLAAGRLAEAAALLAALQPTRETETYELALAQQQFAAATGGTAQDPAPKIQATAEQSTSEGLLAVVVSPNPFNPETRIRFRVSGEETQEVSLIIFNALGQKVCTLVAGRKNPGDYTVSWRGRDDFGNAVASGLYLLQTIIGQQVLTRKLTLLR